jgi:hypothetical protein
MNLNRSSSLTKKLQFRNIEMIIQVFIIIYISILTYTFLTTTNTFGKELYLNYTSGYIRRGLIGQITYFFVKTFQIPLLYIDFFCSLLVKISTLTLLIVLIIRKKIDLILIFSPPLLLAGFLYSGGSNAIFGKLDFLLLLIFLIQIILYKKNKNFYLYISLGTIGVFVHELFYFISFLPSILLLMNNKKRLFIYLSLLSILLVIQWAYKGSIPQINEISEEWKKIGIFTQDTDRLKKLVSSSSINFWWNVNKTFFQKIGFILNNLLVLFFIIIMFIKKEDNIERIKSFIKILFFQNIVFFSLSMIANDYGRWYFILFTTIILYFYLYEEDKSTKVINLKFNKSIEKLYYTRYILYFFIGVPIASWSLHFFKHSLPAFKIFYFLEKL